MLFNKVRTGVSFSLLSFFFFFCSLFLLKYEDGVQACCEGGEEDFYFGNGKGVAKNRGERVRLDVH